MDTKQLANTMNNMALNSLSDAEKYRLYKVLANVAIADSKGSGEELVNKNIQAYSKILNSAVKELVTSRALCKEKTLIKVCVEHSEFVPWIKSTDRLNNFENLTKEEVLSAIESCSGLEFGEEDCEEENEEVSEDFEIEDDFEEEQDEELDDIEDADLDSNEEVVEQSELNEEQKKCVETAVNRIIARYMEMKEVYWCKEPRNLGVLTPDGVLTLNRESRTIEYDSECESGIANSLYTKIAQASGIEVQIKMGGAVKENTYCAEHLAKMLERLYEDSGVATLAINEESYFLKVKDDLRKSVSNIVSGAEPTDELIEKIVEMHTCGIIVSSFDNYKKIVLKVVAKTRLDKGELINGIGSADSFKRNGLIVSSAITINDLGYYELTVNISDKLEEFVSKQYGELVANTVNNIEKVYTGLFSSGYGVIEPDGLICDSNEGGVYVHLINVNGHGVAKRENNIIMEDITELFMSNMELKQHDARKITLKAITEGYNYFPMKLLEIAFGRCASSMSDINNEVYKKHSASNIWKNGKTGYWDTVVQEPLTNECLSIIKDLVRHRQLKNGLDITDKEQKRELGNLVKGLLHKLYLAYTPCIILSENSEGRLKIRISDTENKINANNILPSLLGIVGSKEDNSNNTSFVQRLDGKIKEFEVIKEAKLCGASPLFAYTALNKLKERGEAPSWDNLILGRAEDDSIYIGNNNNTDNKFNCLGNTVVHVSAGSRSGKGVATLNILASAYASLIPVFYLDGKPDMSALINYMAKKYGTQTFAINGALYDPKADKGGVIKQILDNKTWRIPECASKKDQFAEKQQWGALEYVKAMNFCVWLMVQVSQGKIEGYDNIVVVADELWKVIGKWKEFINKWKPLRTSQKDIESGKASELAIYANFLTDWYHNSISSWIGASQSSTNNILPTLFAVYQEHQITSHTAWKPDKLEDGANPANSYLFKGLTSIGNAGLIGYDAKDTQAIAKTDKGRKYLTKANRYFAFVSNMDIQDENSADFFKPFLILNDIEDEDRESSYVGEMKKQLQSNGLEPERVLKEHRTDGVHLDSGIGFEGYIESMGGDIKSALSSSYEIAHKVLGQMGYYKSSGACTPFEFFTDFRKDYMLSWDQMNKALESGVMGSSNVSGELGADNESEEDLFESYSQYQVEAIALDNKAKESVGDLAKGFGGTVDNSIYSKRAMEYQQMYGDEVDDLGEDLEDDLILDFGTEEPVKKEFISEELVGASSKTIIDFTPEITPYDGEEVAQNSGNNFRKTVLNPPNGSSVLKCTQANSIKVSMPESATAERYGAKLFSTLGGTKYEFNSRWKAVLNGIEKGINKNLVTRIVLTENRMYVNKNIIHLDGITGGIEDIRLCDLVEFGALFKKFRNIEELTMDSVIFEGAVNDYKNPFISLFEMSGSLRAVIVLQGSGQEPIVFTRADLDSGNKERMGTAGQLVKEARFRNSMDLITNEMSSKKESVSPGEKMKLNQSALNLSKRAGGKFKETSKRKDTGVLRKSAGLMGYGVGTVGLMMLGGTLGLLGKAFGRKKHN